MADLDPNDLTRVAADFRAAIERSRAEKAEPALPYFPEGACTLVSRLFALHLRRRGATNALRFATGHLPGKEAYARHAWLLVDDAIVDLTADPFGESSVVVGAPTRFHESLDNLELLDADAGIAAFREDEAARYHRLLGPIEARMPGFNAPSPE